jgi:hypothetical protein
LLHVDSKLGAWQDVAREFIAQHVGFSMALSDLMPSDNI